MNRFTKIALAGVTGLTLLGATAAWASPGECGGMMGGGRHGMMGRVDFTKITPEQARTLVEARMIMSGDQNLKVGTVEKTQAGYKATIVDSAGKPVRTIDMPPERWADKDKN